MSTKGVSNNLNENSGRIQFLNSASDNGNNNSFIYMGNSDISEESLVSVYCEENGAIINENALIFSDIKSVEEWLKRRTDPSISIDFEGSQNDDLYVSMTNSPSTNLSNLEHNIQIEQCSRPTTKAAKVSGPSENDRSKHRPRPNTTDLESENTITVVPKLYANPCISGVGQNVLVLPEFPSAVLDNKSSAENVMAFSNFEQLTVLSSPIKSISNNNVSRLDFNGIQEKVLLSNLQKSNSMGQVFYSGANKTLPLIRISKDCLIKGKLLDKSEFPQLNSKNSNLLAIGSSKHKSNQVPQTLATAKVFNQECRKPNIIKRRMPTSFSTSESATVGLVAKSNPLMALPVKPLRKVSKNSLLKINQPKTLIRSVCMGEESPFKPYSDDTTISVRPTHKNKSNYGIPITLAISTDKTDDTTEVIIKTESGENLYKGKGSDIMKATRSHAVNSFVKLPGSAIILAKHRVNAPTKVQVATADLLTRIQEDILESGENLFSCPIEGCSHVTTKASCLKAHITQHDNVGSLKIRPFKCDFPGCSWAFYTSFRLKRHQEIHLQKHAFECPIEGCNRSFSTTYNVNTHIKLHQRPTAVACSVDGCDKAFQTRKGYEKHLQEHGLDFAPYQCQREGCGKKYFTVNSLNSHSRVHQHTEEELKCSYCGKMFDAPCRLKSHINVHIGVKPYKCDFEGCMWSFITSSKLRRHQRKHTQTRKHQCKVCGKAFLRPEHLKDHTLKHFLKKSFVCPIADCGASLLNKSSMYAHLKKHRNQETRVSETQTYPCPMEGCDIAFNAKESLRAHLQLMHTTPNSISDNMSQDTIQMLTDDNIISFESMQNNSSNSGTVTFNSMTQEGLLVGMSDLVQCIPPMEEEEYNDSASEHIITHVVFTDDSNVEGDSSAAKEEQQIVLTEIEDEIGSARTGLTYQEAVEGKRHVAEYEIEASGDSLPAGLHSASDVVLSAGLLASQDNLDRTGLLLQDELSSGDLYGMGGSAHEEGLLGPGGELQVLLLDPANRLQHSDFEQSTINLRDLE